MRFTLTKIALPGAAGILALIALLVAGGVSASADPTKRLRPRTAAIRLRYDIFIAPVTEYVFYRPRSGELSSLRNRTAASTHARKIPPLELQWPGPQSGTP